MENLSQDVRECIEHCWDCRHECQTTLFNHCLEMGGKHADPDHVKIMMDCIEMCQIAADAMTRGSRMQADICMAAARVCDACAETCEKIGGKEMKRCAELCHICADACRGMVILHDMVGTGHITGETHFRA